MKVRVEKQIDGKGLKTTYKSDKLPTQLMIKEQELQKIIDKKNIIIGEKNVIDVKDVLLIVNIVLGVSSQIIASNLAKELNVSIEELLAFAEDENIDIEDENSIVSESIADMVREYI